MKDKRRWLQMALLGAVLLSLGLMAGRWYFSEQAAGPAAALRNLGGPFTLQAAEGPVSLADFEGRLVAIYFGYTHCPDVCPTTLATLARALDGLNEDERARVQGLLVSVDPERDTPERLAEYVGYFHSSFRGVTGTPEAVRQVAEAYGAFYRKAEMTDSAMGYSVDHSSTLYLVNHRGELQGMIRHSTRPTEVADQLRAALAKL